MRLVPRADIRPHVCAVLPQIEADHRDGFIDTGNELVAVDPHIYVSVVAARQMAELVGYVPQAALDTVRTELTSALTQLEHATARADEAEQKLRAIDVLESEGFRARKKPGRKPAEKVEEVAA